MRNRIRKMAGLWLLAGTLAIGSVTAVCAAQSSVIESVSVTFKTTYGDAEDIPMPEITAGGQNYSLGDIQFRTEYDNWKPGKKVRVEITLNAGSGKYFPVSLNKSKCSVSGAEYVSAKALDDTTLQVKADYKPVMKLGNTVQAGWSGSSKKKAVWKSVEYAPGYTLNLYGDGKVVKRLTVKSNNADLSAYMEDMDKTYFYEVKAVPTTSEEKKYLKEGEFVTSTDQEFDWVDFENSGNSGSSTGDGGSFKGDGYVLPDGSKAKNTWKKISGQWYYFDGNGNRQRGWLNTGGRWYYMDGNGTMLTGWVDVGGGSWYYLGPDGDMRTGWLQPTPGFWYYMDPSGLMQKGWTNVNEKWYYMDQSGRMMTDWINDGGKWYYLRGDGSLAVNTVVEGWTIGADGVAFR